MRQNILYPALLFFVLLVSISCDLPEGPAYGKGTLTLLLPKTQDQEAAAYNKAAALSRSVLSDGFIGTLIYRLTLTGPGGTQALEAGGGGTTLSLDAGDWTIEAKAYDPGDLTFTTPVGTGSAVITVIAGRNTSVRIPMSVDPAYETLLTEIYIRSEADLRRIGAAENGLAIDNPNRTFYLADNITLSNWTPIGTNTAPFKAKFDGRGNTITIKGFTAASLSGEYLGLFAYTDGAEIKNLKIHCDELGNSDYPLALTGTGWIHAGVLAGYADNGSVIENVSVSGSLYVSAAPDWGLYFGGIAGGNSNDSIISFSHVRADLYMYTEDCNVSVGGLAGENKSAGGGGGIIEKSSFAGKVFVRDDSNPSSPGSATSVYAGGVVGDMHSGNVSACWASGTVDVWSFGGLVYAGGIAGGSKHIERCYAWTFVNADGSADIYAGGIGGIIHTGTFSQCYARGTVTSTNNSYRNCWAGGIAGNNYQGTIEYCAALNDVTSNNGDFAYGIAGKKELSWIFTDNFAANDKTVFTTGSPPSDSDLEGDARYECADFEGPSAGPVYGPSPGLNWTFGGSNWKFLSGSSYDYPVLYWQDSPPPDPSSLSGPPPS